MNYVESEVLELKRELTNEITKEIIAFANARGGQIIIGIEDDGNVLGVQDAKQVCEGYLRL